MDRQTAKTVDNWELRDNRLEKTFYFDDFARAAVFFNRLVNPIEELAHYPRITIAFNRVTVSLFTPEAGKVTDKDMTLAAMIDALC